MSDISNGLIWAGAMLAMTAVICFSALVGWRGWLEVRRQEIAASRHEHDLDQGSGVRIEVANLKERLRKLEAIARGVDL